MNNAYSLLALFSLPASVSCTERCTDQAAQWLALTLMPQLLVRRQTSQFMLETHLETCAPERDKVTANQMSSGLQRPMRLLGLW